MKNKTLSLMMLGCLSSVSVASAQEAVTLPEVTGTDPLIADARQQTMMFAKDLKSTLMQGMKADGPIAAINLCNTEAPALAAKHSRNGWEVGRTSEKLRNTANAPDEWEASILADFAARAAAGEDITTLEASKRENGEFRYMKAIPVGGPCVACHGTALAEPVAAKLDALYPNDQARGYSPGELRGAFTLKYTFEQM